MLSRIDWWRVALLVLLTATTIMIPVALVAGHANGPVAVVQIGVVASLWVLTLDGAR